MPKKKKNERGAGRKKTRNDADFTKVGPFEVHKDVRRDWLAICEANRNPQAKQFREIVQGLVDGSPDEKPISGGE